MSSEGLTCTGVTLRHLPKQRGLDRPSRLAPTSSSERSLTASWLPALLVMCVVTAGAALPLIQIALRTVPAPLVMRMLRKAPRTIAVGPAAASYSHATSYWVMADPWRDAGIAMARAYHFPAAFADRSVAG